MAIYVVTNDAETDWDEKHRYKYRFKAKSGALTAQAEVEDRKSQGKPVVLWRWFKGKSTIIERHNV